MLKYYKSNNFKHIPSIRLHVLLMVLGLLLFSCTEEKDFIEIESQRLVFNDDVGSMRSLFSVGDVALTYVSDTEVQVQFTSSTNSKAYIDYGENINYGEQNKGEFSLNNSTHQQSIEGLEPGTTYFYKIVAMSEEGEHATASGSFTMSGNALDAMAFTIGGLEFVELRDTEARIKFTTGANSQAYIEYGTDMNYGNQTDGEASFDNAVHTQSITGLQPGTLYYYQIRTNTKIWNTASASGSFVTAEASDVVEGGLPEDIDSTYAITFEDDFDQTPGTLPDANKWESRLPWGPDVIINNERQYYTDILNGDTAAPNPFDFDGDSNLVITVGLNDTEQVKATGQLYYSGVLTGAQSTPFRDGYIEARIFFEPDVEGFWGGFWLLHRYYDYPRDTGANGKRRTEIDWELIRGQGVGVGGPYDTDRAQVAYHYDDGQWSISAQGFKGPNGAIGESVQCDGTPITGNYGEGVGPVQQPSGLDLAGEWHRYGIWKTDEFVKWYLDGVLVASICDPAIVSQVEMYPIVNIALGDRWPGPPDAADYPTSMLVDYIKLWEPQ